MNLYRQMIKKKKKKSLIRVQRQDWYKSNGAPDIAHVSPSPNSAFNLFIMPIFPFFDDLWIFSQILCRSRPIIPRLSLTENIGINDSWEISEYLARRRNPTFQNIFRFVRDKLITQSRHSITHRWVRRLSKNGAYTWWW